ncbi:alpha-amylase family glycosyl hydrolase [Oceanicella sp. SM1341]|uniref:alpha-amylase family glycosyl hydrolase n=1 Tax=Oceanicella sp. SM1341 TaxID=1548889 RepID=UPI0018E4FA7E|nr:alpha-amylase family glycosyl hydrolase [Oceanicella sp. SM1341]
MNAHGSDTPDSTKTGGETPVRQRLEALLATIYPAGETAWLMGELESRLSRGDGQAERPVPKPIDEADVVLITYGDSILAPGAAPLTALKTFLEGPAGGLFSAVHVLPFYPWTSDDGFSVTDYRAVDEKLGTWAEIAELAEHHDLMADAVVNHISAESAWFEAFRECREPYVEYFLTRDPAEDLSAVTRPRATPLLTPVETAQGVKHVWTTFSADQVDLNYASPKVFLEVADLMLFYVEQGARLIRLDAIGFIWKEPGTTCMHLPQAHGIIQAIRMILDHVTPGTILITETNVPHADNISYFGDGTNEAHMVYQFPLPPLVLHAFLNGDGTKLKSWLAALEPAPGDATFFNFLSSHDGVGLRPVEGLLEKAEIDAMVAHVRAVGGQVSMRSTPAGESPYELNTTYLDGLSRPGDSDAVIAARMMAAQSILVALAGVPAIYVHSLLGSRNDLEGLARTGRARSINRAKIDMPGLEADLARPDSLRSLVLEGHRALLANRRALSAFHPKAAQQVLPAAPGVFALLRGEGAEAVCALVNLTDAPQEVEVPQAGAPFTAMLDPVAPGAPEPLTETVLTLPPYAVRWLTAG